MHVNVYFLVKLGYNTIRVKKIIFEYTTACNVFAFFFPICINLISTVLIGLTTKIDRSHWRIAHYANWKK